MSLHDGDIGVVETIRFGERAIPSVAAFLFEPEPSGLYETRRRAGEALAGLKAYDTFRDYLRTPRDIADPIERTGEEAVMNAAARVLGDLGDERDLKSADGLLEEEIADCLLSHFDAARAMIDATIGAEAPDRDAERPWWLKGKTLPVLLRVRAQRAATTNNLITRKGQK